MAEAVATLIADLRAAYSSVGDRERAAGQKAYMKSTLPYYGVTAPESRKIVNAAIKAHTLPDRDAWERALRTLWDGVHFREEWYAAIGIARARCYAGWATDPESLPLYEHMIRAGAWWDVCDEIAQHLVRPMLAAHRGAIDPVMRAWSEDEHLWIRRCGILCQNGLKDATDPDLLRACILPSIDDTDFFSRKGIGWALREYSKVNPDWVRAFVAEFDGRLSGLSQREALRLLPAH